MTRPYTLQPFTVSCMPVQCEDVLVVQTRFRRAALTKITRQRCSIYERKRTPFADDVVMGVARLRREERISAQVP